MTLKRLAILLAILIFLAGVGIAWLWQYAYTPDGRARVIIAQLKGDTTSPRGWLLQHHLVRPGFPPPREDGTPDEREWNSIVAATDEMVKLGRDIQPIVSEALHGDNHDVCLMAIWTCGKLRDPAAIRPLLDFMHNKTFPRDPETKAECVNSLIAIGPEAYGPLISLLDDPQFSETDYRWEVACPLGKVKDRRVTDALIRHLGDKDEGAACGSAVGLGVSGDPRGISALLKTFRDKGVKNTVRFCVAGALARTGQDEGLQYLMAKLKSPDKMDRVCAANQLVQHHVFGTRPVKGAFELLLPLLSDPSAGVRSSALLALGELHDPRAFPAVKKLLKDPTGVRFSAQIALNELGPESPPASQPGKP
jgi:HEAT repeat protein